MTTLVKITLALILALLLSSCGFNINMDNFGNGKKGNGTIVMEDREITEPFTTIDASEGIVVYLTQADDFELNVEADENIISLIGTDIQNGRLKIHALENIGNATKKVFVSLPDIEGLEVSSGAHINGENALRVADLDIDASSGAMLRLEVMAESLNVDASSGANMTLAGNANTVYLDGSSGANIRAKDLEADICRADGSSGANLSIHVRKELTADAGSGANIRYLGDAQVTKNKSVSGNISKY